MKNSTTKNHPTLSAHKVLCLALMFLCGELPSDVRRKLNRIFGQGKIADAFRTLSVAGLIRKINQDSMRGYTLTDEGVQYLAEKCPGKYELSDYDEDKSHQYETSSRIRRRHFARVLLAMYLNGINIDDHSVEVCRVLNGCMEEITTPFFVPMSVMCRCHPRLFASYGTLCFGAIFSARKVMLVYAPTGKDILYKSCEERLKRILTDILRTAAPPYQSPEALEYVYYYQNDDDIVHSFSPEGTSNNRTSNILRWYEVNRLTKSCIIGDNSCLRLTDNHLNRKTIAADINCPYYLVQNMSPGVLLTAIQHARSEDFNHSEKILLLCFEEQKELLNRVIVESFGDVKDCFKINLMSKIKYGKE